MSSNALTSIGIALSPLDRPFEARDAQVQAPDDTRFPLDHLALRGPRDTIALEWREWRMDHAGLDAAVGGISAAFLKRGLRRGDRLASWLSKTPLACVLPLACARAGLIYVPINPILKRAQVAHILADSGASVLIAGEGRAKTLRKADRPKSCKLLIEDERAPLTLLSDRLPPSVNEPQDLAAILYTSGSTGGPKGVMLSHANLWLGAISVAHYLRLTADDRVLAALPLSFDYGQNQLLSTWAAGGCVVPLDYVMPRDAINAIARSSINSLAGVPSLWRQLVEAEWPEGVAERLTRITSSGGRLGAPLVKAMRARFPNAQLHSMYGLTEAFRSTSLDPALIDRLPESIGSAIPFAEIIVVREDGREAIAGAEGELVHAGPLVAKGYWNDPERTAERFRPAPNASRYGGIAVWSGDRVVRGQYGQLTFVGRQDDQLKVQGYRISPSEIEEAALASGAVAEAVAIGIDDPVDDQAIVLVLRAATGWVEASAQAAVEAHLKTELPAYMQPREYRWVGAMPLNPNGKVDRVILREEAMA
jgi:acyl-CoA ligase (AMP-forming) (exosortase A-associated)